MQISQSAGDANTSTETGSAGGGKVVYLSKGKGKGKSLLLNGLLLGSICTGIQVKLINHCQAVRIKQGNIQRTPRAYSESGSVS